MPETFDVLICGAGPAGCTAALALGSSGFRTAIIEKQNYPGDKPCGDALPAYIPKILNTINPEYSKAFGKIAEKVPVNSCRLVSPSGRELRLKFDESGYICSRKVFNSFLFDQAVKLPGITVFTETSVKKITTSDDGVVASTGSGDLKAKLLLGCDGANSQAGKITERNEKARRLDFVGVRSYFRNIKEAVPGTFEIHFLKELLPGYFWIFPMAGGMFNAGLGMQQQKIQGKNTSPASELKRIINGHPVLSQRFSGAEMTGTIKGHLLPFSTDITHISGKRIMLCGDAASLINPATGAGIGQAMQSGRYAAWHALKCLERNDFSDMFLRDYDKIVFEKIIKENQRYLFLHKYILKFTWRLNMVIEAGSFSKTFRNFIISKLNA
jgi:geranylgeranyl reductase family protein